MRDFHGVDPFAFWLLVVFFVAVFGLIFATIFDKNDPST